MPSDLTDNMKLSETNEAIIDAIAVMAYLLGEALQNPELIPSEINKRIDGNKPMRHDYGETMKYIRDKISETKTTREGMTLDED